MNILSISDIHGRYVWRNAPLDDADHVIFLGDYVDSMLYDDDEVISNLEAIIRYKKKNEDRVTLLVGNHDIQYLYYPLYPCSGFNPAVQPTLSKLFRENQALFQIAYQQGTLLYTHAGVSATWLSRLLSHTGQSERVLGPTDDMAGFLNDLYQHAIMREYLFEVGPKRGGSSPVGGPVWADRTETSVDLLAGFHQVVGHTPTPAFQTIGNETASITYTDVLGAKTDFFRLTIPT